MVYNIVNVRQFTTKEKKTYSFVDVCCSDKNGSCILTRYIPNELFDTYLQYLSEGSTRIDENDVFITIRDKELFIDFKF